MIHQHPLIILNKNKDYQILILQIIIITKILTIMFKFQQKTWNMLKGGNKINFPNLFLINKKFYILILAWINKMFKKKRFKILFLKDLKIRNLLKMQLKILEILMFQLKMKFKMNMKISLHIYLCQKILNLMVVVPKILRMIYMRDQKNCIRLLAVLFLIIIFQSHINMPPKE